MIMLAEVKEVILKMDKYSIITLKKKGFSIRKIAHELGIDRKTVTKIWKRYEDTQEALVNSSREIITLEELTEKVIGETRYNSEKRTKRKLSSELQKRILDLLEEEIVKQAHLGKSHKQKRSAVQIHEYLVEDGVDIGLSTVTNFIRETNQAKEVYIRQDYVYGDRLEFDFGEVKLLIKGQRQTFYLAVFAAPASGYRYAYLYKKQNQSVFLDAHVRFFDLMKGSWKEVVYDNMRNVISQFKPHNEKIIHPECLNLALYYNFEVNTTNARSGNEKGTVENGVKVIRNRVFTHRYQFESYDEACLYLSDKLVDLNRTSLIEEERKYLQASRPPYELAKVETHTVDKYSCIRVENNFYSIPDLFIHRSVVVKHYHDYLRVYSHKELVCEHKKIDGYQNYQLVLSHYLKTLTTKPGALTHSLVLKQHPELYTIYQTYFKSRNKEFIEVLLKHKHTPIEDILQILKVRNDQPEVHSQRNTDSIQEHARKQLLKINQLMN